jgi:hypothetical protein
MRKIIINGLILVSIVASAWYFIIYILILREPFILKNFIQIFIFGFLGGAITYISIQYYRLYQEYKFFIESYFDLLEKLKKELKNENL